MASVSHAALIDAATAVIHRHRSGDRLFGDVAAMLVTAQGNR